ncbi:MAG: nickel pincer cofactor biosynthesis protein LarB [Gemmatimonadaceae bacterium]|nr:nickel pincer cofactor biosynthesis protein LarB [Gemmatimonadaceae bacterium]
MTPERARAILDEVVRGTLTVAAALEQLATAPLESLGFATVDHHRALRQGVPEVIFGAGKTREQVVAIAERLAARGDGFLVTRAEPEVRAGLVARFAGARVNDLARTVALPADRPVEARTGRVLVVTAGTSDLPVAEEAVETLHAIGIHVDRLTDVGVAGIHRLLSRSATLREASVIIVVAGMDGALPSVVGGLVACPVIAVPTSVGYGAAFGGIAPLLTALNSCAAGVTVVNIDNGFGAAMAAGRIVAR